ncbi:TLD domain-containing protein 1-like isoform X2 [Diaphorina citri]|uniref:MTOR-associated protein MEAK7 n=1 Tax=Diaphorina citri TaxID=121845 RepID=A0A1S4EJF4_DIACI|nr:TLD domain-containing protein 1-like isoform X1 [Diaphorina citri]XP_026684237.1 TLD domain-containing protein 1-like isoform X2 [Diaphorina citri]
MGNEHSNKKQGSGSLKKNLSRKIKPEDVKKIKSLTNGKDVLTKVEVFELWSMEIKDSLINFYLKYYFPDKTEKIDLSTFISLYYELDGSNIDRKVEILLCFIGSYGDLINYVQALLNSCLFIYQSRDDKELWSSLNIDSDKGSLIVYANYLCMGDCNNEITFDSLQKWLSTTHEIAYLHKYVLSHMFGFNTSQRIIPTPVYNPSFTMSILDYSHIMFLNLNLMPEFQKQWRLLFSSQFQGESFTRLMACAINQGPLLVLVKDDKSNIFGAYASTNLTLCPKFYGDQNSFLFTLKPDMKVFNSSGFNENFIYLNSNQQTLPNGLGFGGQFEYWGLWIDSEYGQGECNKTCSTFKDYQMLSHDKHFKIMHIELWGVGIPPPTAEEKGERSVLDADPTASALLELAGKTKHSAGLREPDIELEN